MPSYTALEAQVDAWRRRALSAEPEIGRLREVEADARIRLDERRLQIDEAYDEIERLRDRLAALTELAHRAKHGRCRSQLVQELIDAVLAEPTEPSEATDDA